MGFGTREVEDIVEEIEGVVWSGVGFGVVLSGDDVEFGAFEAFWGVVVDVALRNCEGTGVVDGIPMVLRGHDNSAGVEVLDGLVDAAVTEFHLGGFAAEGVRDDLLSETDPGDREFTGEFVDEGFGCVEVFGVTRAV